MNKINFYNDLAEMKNYSIISREEAANMEDIASWFDYTEFDGKEAFHVIARLENEDDISRVFIIEG